ncbi:plasmid transfer protein TraB [Pseudonocardia acaciae]|uniref:plasmid transfer protein TraB n=1 Tax=Pseudonocardia acaciae TaxID=551276 RepID=UPI0012ECBCEB|nr:plasmid transfer protein TraB [Pseudonocardia acaciae]
MPTGEAKFGFYVPRKYWASRVAPYAAEWAGLVVTWPIGYFLHSGLGAPARVPWASAFLVLLGTGLSALTWQLGRARGASTRWMATATVAIGGLWFLVATVIGPADPLLFWVWLLGGSTLALAWNIKYALRSGEDEGTNALFEKVGLAKVRTGQVEAAPGSNKVTVPLSLPAGEASVEDVQKATDQLAQGLRLHKGSVRVTPNQDDLSQATMTIVPTDVLRTPQPWPGPSHPGGSITDPIVPGLYEDNEPVRLWLPGDPSAKRNATHVQINGMNGAGKSEAGKLTWAEILTRRDVVLVILDPSKGEQTAGFLPDDSAHLIIGERQCQAFVRKVPAAISAQAHQLGQWGYDQWVPEVYDRFGMPYVVLWVEEASKVLQDAATLTTIAETARSAGFALALSQQRSTFRRMNTDIRAQLGAGWCFGVKDPDDAAFCLSDEVIDAGARPDRWKNRRPGCFYLEAPGIPEERLAMPARTFNRDTDRLIQAIAAHAGIRARLFGTTAAALGLPPRPVRTTTIRPNQPAGQAGDQQGGDHVVSITTLPDPNQPGLHRPESGHDPASGVSAAELADATDLDALAELPDDLDAAVFGLPTDPEPDLAGDGDTKLPEDPDIADAALPRSRPTRAEARAKLRELVNRQAAKGLTEFSIRDLPEPAQLFGRGRSWLSGELSRLADAGVLEVIGQDGNATVYRVRTRHERNAA